MMTTLVAVAIAPIASLGVQLGTFALFLMISTIVICLRFIDGFNGSPTVLAWTVATACVIIPLDLYFVLMMLCT